MKTITLQAENATAKKLEFLSDDKKMELVRLIELWISEPGPILQVMEEMGEYAAKQGLTRK